MSSGKSAHVARNVFAALATGLAAAGCTHTPGTPHYSITDNLQPEARWEHLTYCGGWACQDKRPISFSTDEIDEITNAFGPPAATPLAEREAVRRAVAEMEKITGAHTGYDRDKGGTVLDMFEPGQLDCYSEAANTNNFLQILTNEGFLRYHDMDRPVMRGYAVYTSWRPTHATAVIRERQSGQQYVVDTWFHDNGVPPEIVELEAWMTDWAPENGATL